MNTPGQDIRKAKSPPLAILRAMRPHQWVKNLFVGAPLIFAKELLEEHATVRVLMALVSFCLISSSVYILNDIRDVEADRRHPTKSKRPIACGDISLETAQITALSLAVVSFVFAYFLGYGVVLLELAYFAINVAYSFFLKHIAYVDVLCIALGFELRVLTGSFAAEAPPSKYLLLATFSLALFLGFGKRLHELQALGARGPTRASLQNYRHSPVSTLLYVTGVGTWLVYVAYTIDPSTVDRFHTKWLVLTIPFVAFGLLRFSFFVRARNVASSPTDYMLRDPLFLLNLLAWCVSTVLVVYLRL